MARIVVIGAGITGVTASYALLERGHHVTLVDRHHYPAMETSFANGGQLSASNAEVWNSLPTIRKGIGWMFRPDAPLLLNPSPSYHKYSWMAEFCGNVRHHRRNTIETTRLAIAAREYLFELAAREKIDFDVERRGILHFYRDKASFDAAAVGNALLREGGLERYPVTPAEIRDIEPTLQGDFHGGFFTPSDSTGDIHKFTRALAAACVKKGAVLLLGAAVDAITTDGCDVNIKLSDPETRTLRDEVHAEYLLICAGVESRRLAAMVGDRINIYPVKGYSITVLLQDTVSQSVAPTVSLLDDAAKIVTSRLGPGRFRVAGTAELNGFNKDIRADRIQPLVRWSREHFPQLNTSAVIPWTGLRPMTPNMMPRVGRGNRPNVYYNTGHGHLGWTLSPVTAQLIAAAISEDIRKRR